MDPVYAACQVLKAVLIARAPYDTGNLALNSIRIDIANARVLIGGNDIAPYAPFTNEPWTHGQNPNEGWIERAIEEAMPIIKSTLDGKLTEEDVDEALATYRQIQKERLERRSAAMLQKIEELKGK